MAQARILLVQWRPKAQDDLRAVLSHIAKGDSGLARPSLDNDGLPDPWRRSEAVGPDPARMFGQELRIQIGKLAQCPELGRTGRPGLPGDVRELIVHDDYVVFYRVLAQAGVVEILRIKHASRQAL